MSARPIADELRDILPAIEILSPATLRFAGGPEAALSGLAALLYPRCYCYPFAAPALAPPPPDPTLPTRLSAANQARERWDAGWRVYQAGADGRVFVFKGERQRSAVPGEFLSEAYAGAPPVVGATVTLRAAREAPTLQPGFHHMFGETLGDVWEEHNLVRFYFHCTPSNVTEWVERLTATLNRLQTPYRLKALTDATHYTRADAMVLYVARRYLHIVALAIDAFPATLFASLRSCEPMFTLRWRPGVGVAEDPRNGESFGMNRCRLVAEAVIGAWQTGRVDVDARLAAVRARFAADGLSLDRPWLASATADVIASGLPMEKAA
jgi:hypothetical protein